ncbi:MAG: hypothetical protein AAF611_23545 [Bacteroidota bacterium]
MKNTLKIAFTIILMLLMNGCGKNEKKEQKPIEKETSVVQRDFGNWEKEHQRLGVELNAKQFDNWSDLVERASKIVCNDSIPKITLKKDDEIKTIYFHNPCWGKDAHTIIKLRNVIEIHNDTIFKNKENFFPLDSLESVLRKDIQNNGIDPIFSENSKKLIISISYDKKNEFEKLPNHLDKLTDKYYGITNETDIKIWLTNKEYVKPPKPAKK